MLRSLVCLGICIVLAFTVCEARPQDDVVVDANQELNMLEPIEMDNIRGLYYDAPSQALYENAPMNRLQMLVAQYRPMNSQRLPNWSMDKELYRVPEMKRQARYRQCYFNPISCFKK